MAIGEDEEMEFEAVEPMDDDEESGEESASEAGDDGKRKVRVVLISLFCL